MASLTHNIAELDDQNGALPRPVRLAVAEVLTAAEHAGHHVPAISWFNPASTPEHHVPGSKGQGGGRQTTSWSTVTGRSRTSSTATCGGIGPGSGSAG